MLLVFEYTLLASHKMFYKHNINSYSHTTVGKKKKPTCYNSNFVFTGIIDAIVWLSLLLSYDNWTTNWSFHFPPVQYFVRGGGCLGVIAQWQSSGCTSQVSCHDFNSWCVTEAFQSNMNSTQGWWNQGGGGGLGGFSPPNSWPSHADASRS